MIAPPPPGTVVEPLELTLPLFTVAWARAPPHDAGRPATVTLTTVPTDRFWKIVRPAVVQRGVAAVAAPSDFVKSEIDAAAPKTVVARPSRATLATRRKGFIVCLAAAMRVGGPRGPPTTTSAGYPLMTKLMPVTETATTAGAKVAAKLVPLAGVVPVASPSDALPAPERVIR